VIVGGESPADGGAAATVVDGDAPTTPAAAPRRPETVLHARPRRTARVVRLTASVVVLFVAALVVDAVVTNQNFQWGVVGQYLTNSIVLSGFVRTIWLTAAAMAIGIVLGIVLALMRLSKSPLLSASSTIYITLFRGTPVIVQLIFWFNLAYLFPRIGIGVPFGGPSISANTNSVISASVAATLGLGLNEGAYMSEIVRGGIQSVPRGQTEAALAIGMTDTRTFRRVILPQALRLALPPTGNEAIGMLKYTAVVSVIGMPDLLFSVESIYNRTLQVVPLLVVACIWYLVATTVLYIIQRRIERRYGRGFAAVAAHAQARPLSRLATRIKATYSVSKPGGSGPSAA
jgi:polar amino acid transport system permease protein